MQNLATLYHPNLLIALHTLSVSGLNAFDTCTQTANALQAVTEFYPQSAAQQLNCVLNSNAYKLGMDVSVMYVLP